MATGHLLSVPIYRSVVMQGYTQSKISHIAVCFPYIHRWWRQTRFMQTVSTWWTHKKDLKTNDLDLDCESAAASQVICSISCAVTWIQDQKSLLPLSLCVCLLMVFVEEIFWQMIEKRRSTVHAWLVALMWTLRSCPQWYTGNLEKSRGFPHLLPLYNEGGKQPEKTKGSAIRSVKKNP